MAKEGLVHARNRQLWRSLSLLAAAAPNGKTRRGTSKKEQKKMIMAEIKSDLIWSFFSFYLFMTAKKMGD
jgi:hypothetical protein